ncbi:MAG: hypothetical protein K1X94_05110 [Sandaracinaceae bacterium]|nr:hypothetical protein [Sandaracinaceae bacterium]
MSRDAAAEDGPRDPVDAARLDAFGADAPALDAPAIDASGPDAVSADAFTSDTNACDIDGNGLCDDLRIGFWGSASPGGAASFGAWVDPNLAWRQDDTSTGSASLDDAMLAAVDVVVFELMRDALTVAELGAIELFVRRGGGVIVMSGYEVGNTFADGVAGLVQLRFQTTLYSGAVTWTGPHPIHAGLPASFESFGGYGLTATTASPPVTVVARTSPTAGAAADFVAVATIDSGRVIVLGDENLTLDRSWGPDSRQFWLDALTWAGGR